MFALRRRETGAWNKIHPFLGQYVSKHAKLHCVKSAVSKWERSGREKQWRDLQRRGRRRRWITCMSSLGWRRARRLALKPPGILSAGQLRKFQHASSRFCARTFERWAWDEEGEEKEEEEEEEEEEKEEEEEEKEKRERKRKPSWTYLTSICTSRELWIAPRNVSMTRSRLNGTAVAKTRCLWTGRRKLIFNKRRRSPTAGTGIPRGEKYMREI